MRDFAPTDQYVGERIIEVEFTRDGEPVRRQVEVSSSAQYRAVESLKIALDPADPTRAVAINIWNFWRRLINPLAFLIVAVVVLMNLANAPWGQDRTWANGAWTLTQAGTAPATSEPNASTLREGKVLQRFQVIGLVAFGALAVGSTYGILRHDAGVPTIGFILSVGMAGIMAGIVIHSRTLQLVMTDAGLTQQTFFGIQRVPGSEIASIQTRNINEKGQRDYAASTTTRFQTGASSPPTVNVDFVVDADGREILPLADQMEPAAFLALRTKIRPRSVGGR